MTPCNSDTWNQWGFQLVSLRENSPCTSHTISLANSLQSAVSLSPWQSLPWHSLPHLIYTGDSAHLPWLTSAEAQGICIHVLHSSRCLLVSYTYVWTKSCPPPTTQAESSRVWIMFQKQHIFSTSDSVGRVTEAWRLKEWTLTHPMLTKAICFLSTGPCLTHEK